MSESPDTITVGNFTFTYSAGRIYVEYPFGFITEGSDPQMRERILPNVTQEAWDTFKGAITK